MSLPELILAGMPLGHPDDVTLRFLRYGRSVDRILCESRKLAQSLLKHHGIERPAEDFLTFDEHTRPDDLDELMGSLSEFRQVLVVSDAGMPIFCDPGRMLLERAEQSGWLITVLPGASALTLATVRAGINGPFFFAGFPPRETSERRRYFAGLVRRDETIVFYETPYRMTKMLEEMKQALSGSEKVFVGIDLSSKHERIFRFRLSEASRVAKTIPKGAPVIILERNVERMRT